MLTMQNKMHQNLNMWLVFKFLLLLVSTMVNEAKGRIFKRKDGKYLIYVPVKMAEDSMFPLSTETAVHVKISFKIGENQLKIEKWNEETWNCQLI